MVYEWDAKRARRTHLVRFGLGVVAAMIACAIPAAIAIKLV